MTRNVSKGWLRGRESFDVTLRDGRRVRIFSLTPTKGGRAALAATWVRARASGWGFDEDAAQFAAAELRVLDELDREGAVAWGAVAIEDPGMPGIAVARYIPALDDPTSADVVIGVRSAFRGVGLGTFLIETLLASAGSTGIRRLIAPPREDDPMQRLFTRVGSRMVRRSDGSMVTEIPVTWRQRTRRASVPLHRPSGPMGIAAHA